MSGKKPPPARMAAIARTMGGTTAAEGKITLTGEMLEQATIEFLERTVTLQKNRHKPEPKCSEDLILNVLAKGRSVKYEMNELGVSRSTINVYRKRHGKNKPR